MGRRNPWTDRVQILFSCRDPGRNHVYQIWWRSVKGFLVGRVPKFALSHWLWWSSLQQCYATACTVMGVAKSDFSQMCWSRWDSIKNAERFARIDLDRCGFWKERNHCWGLVAYPTDCLTVYTCTCSEWLRAELLRQLHLAVDVRWIYPLHFTSLTYLVMSAIKLFTWFVFVEAWKAWLWYRDAVV